MLEMMLTSKNQVLKESVSNIFKRNIMESGGYNLGAYDNSEYSSLQSSDIKFDKNLIRRGIACYMRKMREEEEYYHFIRVLSSIMRAPAGEGIVNQ